MNVIRPLVVQSAETAPTAPVVLFRGDSRNTRPRRSCTVGFRGDTVFLLGYSNRLPFVTERNK